MTVVSLDFNMRDDQEARKTMQPDSSSRSTIFHSLVACERASPMPSSDLPSFRRGSPPMRTTDEDSNPGNHAPWPADAS
jgi:hypothetical protein